MQNIIDKVYDFNQQAGLLNKGYFDILESAYQVEEALEGFDLRKLWAHLQGFNSDVTSVTISNNELRLTAKQISRQILYDFVSTDGSTDALQASYLSDVDRLDKACDAIVFALGSMAKLGLTPSQIEQALQIVTTANLQKLGMPKDDHGKLIKPQDFIGPETLLQELLDQRKD